MAHKGKLILLFPGYLVHLGDVLRSHPHEDVVEGIYHAVVVHAVDELLFAHLETRAGAQEQVRDARHARAPDRGADIYLSEEDLLVHDLCGPQGRDALLVDGAGNRLPGTARMDGDLSSGVRFLSRHVGVAADDLFDELRVEPDLLHRCFQGDERPVSTELKVFEGAEEITHRCPHATHDHHVIHDSLL